MDEQIVEKSPVPAAKDPAVAAERAGRDLSVEIEQAVEREPRDRVKCVRLFDDYYRCNWWAPEGEGTPRERAAWAEVATNRVRKSRFLTATLHEGKLRINDVAVKAAPAS